MTVQFQNYAYIMRNKGKPIYVPTEYSKRLGEKIKRSVENAIEFPKYYFHLRSGGHVAAIHSHREFQYFCKIDIENFFYSIHRNRVERVLSNIAIYRSKSFAKWSCVKIDGLTPAYRLPYGFVQSSILASLVLYQSSIGIFLEQAVKRANVAVYVDDISMASNSLSNLETLYAELIATVERSGFVLNSRKAIAPSISMHIFNCNLRNEHSSVTDERKQKFAETEHTPFGIASFDRYCQSVESGNAN